MDIAIGPKQLSLSLDLNRFLEQCTSTVHLVTPAVQVVRRLHPRTGRVSVPADALLKALLAVARLADRNDGPVHLRIATWSEGDGALLEVGLDNATDGEVRALEALQHLAETLRPSGGSLDVRPRGRRGVTMTVRMPRVDPPARLHSLSRSEAPRLRRAIG